MPQQTYREDALFFLCVCGMLAKIAGWEKMFVSVYMRGQRGRELPLKCHEHVFRTLHTNKQFVTVAVAVAVTGTLHTYVCMYVCMYV